MHRESRGRRFGLVVVVVAAAFAAAAPSAGAASFSWLTGFDDPATPDALDKVGVLKVGSPLRAQGPGPRPRDVGQRRLFRAARAGHRKTGEGLAGVVRRAPGEPPRRPLDGGPAAKRGEATPAASSSTTTSGCLTNPSVTDHFSPSPERTSPFARDWGMRVAVEDLRRVVTRGARSTVARSCSAATRWAARSRRPMRPGTSTAAPGARTSPGSS